LIGKSTLQESLISMFVLLQFEQFSFILTRESHRLIIDPREYI